MSTYSIYFSPTGGTKRVMNILADVWEKAEEIDLSSREQDYSQYVFAKEDVCLVGVPSYGGRVPSTAMERLKKMRGNGAGVVLVVVYGNRAYEDTMIEMKQELEECGFVARAGVAAVAEHSIMHQFAAGRPDEADMEELKGFAVKIQASWDKEGVLTVPGNIPYKELHTIPMYPKANKDCIRCGKCATVCPVGAISLDNPSETQTDKCISCMRCVATCPAKARSVNKLLLAGAVQKLKKACQGRKENELFLPQ